jgi:hypothetical protein
MSQKDKTNEICTCEHAQLYKQLMSEMKDVKEEYQTLNERFNALRKLKKDFVIYFVIEIVVLVLMVLILTKS